MPGPYFVSDKCQEDKCLDPLLVRTNARRTNARTHIIFGQMPGGQMPEPTFGPDKCQEDKCLNPQVQAFVHRGICPLQAFVLRGICPTGGQMPVQAFVLPGICLSRHLSANRLSMFANECMQTKGLHLVFNCFFTQTKIGFIRINQSIRMPFENLLVYQRNNFACIRVASSLIQDMKILIFKTYFNDESYL